MLRGRFCVKRCGPSRHRLRDASAVLEILLVTQKRLFQHYLPTADIRRRLLIDAISAVVASDDAIRREVEGPAAERLLRWARARPGELDHSRRVRFSVQRPV